MNKFSKFLVHYIIFAKVSLETILAELILLIMKMTFYRPNANHINQWLSFNFGSIITLLETYTFRRKQKTEVITSA